MIKLWSYDGIHNLPKSDSGSTSKLVPSEMDLESPSVSPHSSSMSKLSSTSSSYIGPATPTSYRGLTSSPTSCKGALSSAHSTSASASVNPSVSKKPSSSSSKSSEGGIYSPPSDDSSSDSDRGVIFKNVCRQAGQLPC